MHSLHVPRIHQWSRRKSIAVAAAVDLALWGLLIWGVKALLS